MKLGFTNNSPHVERYNKKVLDTTGSVQRVDYSVADEKNKCYRFVTNMKDMGGRNMWPYHLDP